MQHTVLMPFNRPRFFQTLREGMEGQGITWVPLYDSDECHALFTEKCGQGIDWIKPWRGDLPKDAYTHKPTVNPGHWMCDAFLDEQLRDDTQEGGPYETTREIKFFRKDHYVSFMTDDCFWNWNYWRKLQRHFAVRRNTKGSGGEVHPAVILSSTTVKGGGFIAPQVNKLPNGTFDWPSSSYRTFGMRFEVLTVRADKLRDVRFGSFWAGDGIVNERLVEENWDAGEVEFAPECVVYFNALDPTQYGFPAERQP